MRRLGSLILIPLLLVAVAIGCTSSSPTPTSISVSPTEVQKQKDDRENPTVKEARADTEAILNDLLAGKYDNDPNFAPLAHQLTGFESWSLERQELAADQPMSVNFSGTLKGPSGEATFRLSVVKQQNGKWMIGDFSGPDRKQSPARAR
jgi:hypothetical protein